MRVYGDAGVERALTDGYPVLPILDRYCGVDWRTLEPGRPQPIDGSTLEVESFAAGGDAPRYLAGAEVEASGLVFRDRAAAGSPTSRGWPGSTTTCSPGSARATRARRRDVLARRRARAPGHLAAQRARHGPRAALGRWRDARGARRAGATAQGARPHQQHEPDPAGGLSRAGAGRPGAASRSPTMASRSSCERRVHRPPARAGRALPQPAPVPPAHGRGRAHARGAAALGREPLLLPEVHPAEGRGDPGQLPRGRGPARVGPAHHRPRRHRRRDGRHRVVAAARRGARRPARRAGVGAAGPARGALRGRRLRELRAPEAVGRGGRVIAHRAVRAGRDARAARGARASLPVDRPGRARVLPHTARAGAARRAVRARSHRRALPDARAAGRRRRGAALQDRDAVGAARRDRARRHAATGPVA